jgi:hypothetical protein
MNLKGVKGFDRGLDEDTVAAFSEVTEGNKERTQLG